MSNTMEYKGYVGSVEFSQEDSVLFGKVMGIRALISYEGQTVQELVNDFHDAVDAYLNLCAEEGTPPEKAYKGSFNIRISPELHRRAALYATAHQTTLNRVVESALEHYVPAYCYLPRIFPTPPAKLPPEVFFMSPKELLYIDDALGHEQFLIAQCQEAEAALSDPKLKQRVRQLQSAHQQLFNRLMALV